MLSLALRDETSGVREFYLETKISSLTCHFLMRRFSPSSQWQLEPRASLRDEAVWPGSLLALIPASLTFEELFDVSNRIL
jgi:hypothetical protein